MTFKGVLRKRERFLNVEVFYSARLRVYKGGKPNTKHWLFRFRSCVKVEVAVPPGLPVPNKPDGLCGR